jgi:putative SOS response-associated peptidase YedK
VQRLHPPSRTRQLQVALRFVDPLPNDPPRYVVRPTDTERLVAVGKDGQRHFIPMRWGLVPWWANDVKTGLTLFSSWSVGGNIEQG